jgi:hypothetical protein
VFAANNPLGGGVFSTSLSGSVMNLTFTPVPEPVTVLLLSGAGLGIGAGVRRFRKWAAA